MLTCRTTARGYLQFLKAAIGEALALVGSLAIMNLEYWAACDDELWDMW